MVMLCLSVLPVALAEPRRLDHVHAGHLRTGTPEPLLSATPRYPDRTIWVPDNPASLLQLHDSGCHITVSPTQNPRFARYNTGFEIFEHRTMSTNNIVVLGYAIHCSGDTSPIHSTFGAIVTHNIQGGSVWLDHRLPPLEERVQQDHRSGQAYAW